MWHVWDIGAVLTGFWCGNLKEKGQLEDSGIAKRIILKRVLQESNWKG